MGRQPHSCDSTDEAGSTGCGIVLIQALHIYILMQGVSERVVPSDGRKNLKMIIIWRLQNLPRMVPIILRSFDVLPFEAWRCLGRR